MRHRLPRDPTVPLIVDEGAPVAPVHWRPTRWNVRNTRSIAVVLVLLAVALSLLSTVLAYRAAVASSREAAASSARAAKVDRRLSALEDYVDGKGAQRDAENTRLNQRINDAVCSVLDQLPAGGRLDVVRQSYGCGPGVPASGAMDRSTPRPAPTTGAPAAQTVTRPPAAPSSPASTSPPAEATTPPPAATSPPTSAPRGVLCTLLDLFCPRD